MIRGTTAQFKFKIPCTYNELEWVAIKFWQDGNNGTSDAPLPIIKSKGYCSSLDEGELCVYLSAEETKRFSDRSKAKVQLSAKKWDGTRFASHQQLITVYPIQDDIITPPDEELPDDDTEDGWTVLDGGPIEP